MAVIDVAARRRSLDPLAGDARPDPRAGRRHRRRAGEGRDRGLGRPAARAPGARRPVGRPAVVARLHRHVPRPRAPAPAGARSRERPGASRRRPRPRAHHLAGSRLRDPVGRPSVLRGRGRAVHQRQRRRDRRVLRRGHDARSSTGCSASSWRTVAGTARSRTVRRSRRSARRSTSSRACSNTSARSVARPE